MDEGYAVITENPSYGWEVFTNHRDEDDAQGMRAALLRSNPARKVEVVFGGERARCECELRNTIPRSVVDADAGRSAEHLDADGHPIWQVSGEQG